VPRFSAGVYNNTVLMMIDDDGDEIADKIHISVTRIGLGAAAGDVTANSLGRWRFGFYADIGGPDHIVGEAQLGATVGLKQYLEATICHEFDWPPASSAEAREMYLLLGEGYLEHWDQSCQKLWENAAAGEWPDWLEYEWSQASLGVYGSGDVGGGIGIDTASSPLGVHASAGLGASGSAYAGIRHYKSDRIRACAGIRVEDSADAQGGFGIPNIGSNTRGADSFIDFTHGSADIGGGLAAELYLEKPSTGYEVDEIGFLGSVFDPTGSMPNHHLRVFANKPSMVNEIIGREIDLFQQVDLIEHSGALLRMDLNTIANGLLAWYELVTELQQDYENGEFPAGQGWTLGYEIEEEIVQAEQSANWFQQLEINFGPFYGSIGRNTLKEITYRAVVERGDWVKGLQFNRQNYGSSIPRATASTYDQIIQTIVDALPPGLTDGFSWFGLFDKYSGGRNLVTLPDGRSTLEIDPESVPGGVTARAIYWHWSDSVVWTPLGPYKQRAMESYSMDYGVGGFHQFEPEGMILSAPALMTLAYADSDLVGIDAADLSVYYEDKEYHRFIHVGGEVVPDSNIVRVPINVFHLYTLAPNVPTGEYGFDASPVAIPANGSSVTTLISDVIYNNDGTVIPDGTCFTLTATNGDILATDADTLYGLQVASMSGRLEFNLRSSEIPFPALVTATSVNSLSAVRDTVEFLDSSIPAAPTGLQVLGSGMHNILVTWNRNSEVDVAGYRVYFDTDIDQPPYDGLVAYGFIPSPIDAAGDTTITIMGLDLQTSLYITVTAYDVSGNESPYAIPVLATATTGAGGTPLDLVLGLDQNIPNPFNPVTEIRYSLSRAGYVSLKVYDLRGRLVKTLVDGAVDAGRHEAVWRADDDSRRRVASGVYLYLLQTEEGVRTRKMAVIR